MVRPAPDRQNELGKPNRTIGRAAESVSLTYLNGCSKHKKENGH